MPSSEILVTPRSLGHALDTSPEAFGSLQASNDILGSPEALRARLAADGYLYIKKFFDPSLILPARRVIFERLAADGVLDPARDLMQGVVRRDPLTGLANSGSFRPDLAEDKPEIQRVVFGPEICDFYTRLFGEPIRHFDYIWCRPISPGHGTAAHCDWVYMGRGTPRLLTCWIPYVDISLDVGGLIVLENPTSKPIASPTTSPRTWTPTAKTTPPPSKPSPAKVAALSPAGCPNARTRCRKNSKPVGSHPRSGARETSSPSVWI